MVNNFAEGTLNLKSTYLFKCINDELNEHKFPYSIVDNQDESKIWNIYDAYDRRTYNEDERIPVTEDTYTDGFGVYVLLEYIEDPSLFAQKKVWFILRGHNYHPGHPYLEEYKGRFCWDSTEFSYEDIIHIINILDRQFFDGCQREYDEYMSNKDDYMYDNSDEDY